MISDFHDVSVGSISKMSSKAFLHCPEPNTLFFPNTRVNKNSFIFYDGQINETMNYEYIYIYITNFKNSLMYI